MDTAATPETFLDLTKGTYVMQHESCSGEVSIVLCRACGPLKTTWVGEGIEGDFTGSGFRSDTFPHSTKSFRIWTEEQVREFQKIRQSVFEEMGCPMGEAREAFKTRVREIALGM
ncbi:MAG: hypothetical protein E6R03_10475 [Hyphomicrobiaceae bacterium]|nr:MAG: hypothetical protein E6R03_10475 [Hyphomicrobiaceae bacterium]